MYFWITNDCSEFLACGTTVAARPSAGFLRIIVFTRINLVKANNFTKTKKLPALGLAVVTGMCISC